MIKENGGRSGLLPWFLESQNEEWTGTNPAWACVGLVIGAVPATASGGDTRGVGIGAVVMGKPSSTTTCSSTNLQCPLISRRQSPLLNVKLAVFGMTFSSKTSKMQNFKSLNPFFAPPCMPNALLKKVLIIWSRGMANPLLFLTNLLRSVMGRLRHRCSWIFGANSLKKDTCFATILLVNGVNYAVAFIGFPVETKLHSDG